MAEAYESDDMEYSDDEFDCGEEFGFSDHDEDLFMPKKTDPEHFEHELLKPKAVEEMVTKKAVELCEENVSPSVAKMLVNAANWKGVKIDPPLRLKKLQKQANQSKEDEAECSVCFLGVEDTDGPMMGLYCGHKFCRICWEMYLKTQINSGKATRIACMTKSCNVLTDEDFVLTIVKDSKLRKKYQDNSLKDVVTCDPGMSFCPGQNCEVIVFTPEPKPWKPQKVQCTECGSTFCFSCGMDHHAPTDCKRMKDWLKKCKDDSETANYIRANTKDCPRCGTCIEKNGGCNHMHCNKCKLDFCWVCMRAWKEHEGNYNCNKFKEERQGKQNAKQALKKYLFHFERYENHGKSLKLEEITVAMIMAHIQEKVDSSEGTWIDWQYLLTATEQLRKCRYTLMYTYPHVYYLKKGPQKELFELAQSELEREVEELSFKVERAQITDRADIELRMNAAEQRRIALLKDCLDD